MLVTANLGRFDLEMVEELSGVTGVFGGDRIYGLQDSHGAEGHVF